MMEKEFIKELINLVKNSNIKTLKIEQGDLKIHIETHKEPIKPEEIKPQKKEE